MVALLLPPKCTDDPEVAAFFNRVYAIINLVSQEDFDTIAAAERDKTHNNKIFKQYLIDTDWYISRFSETGKDVPEDILQKRQEARESINV